MRKRRINKGVDVPWPRAGHDPRMNDTLVMRPLLVDDDAQMREFALPTGTVTFLLTDVEGSTRHWEADGEATATAVAAHYELLDAAIARWGGVRPVEQG